MNIFIKRLTCLSLIIFLNHTVSASQVKSPVPRQAPISTIQEALLNVRKVISNFPSNDSVAAETYEKEKSALLVKSAKVLYDNARAQILEALQEIDNRIAYWQYQRNHQWGYFLTKNPLKWITGNTQGVEIESNLEQLQSHQGELYVLLGQLAQLGTAYDHEYKTVFASQHTKGYAWVDGLLNLLPRIKMVTKKIVDSPLFIARATLLKAKLERVRRFKSDILSDMVVTQIPTHFERNWLKYGMLMYFLGQGYSRADQISQFTLDSFDRTTNYLTNVAQDVKQLFFPGGVGRNGLVFQQGNVVAARSAMNNFLDTLEKNKIITAVEKKIVIDDEAKGSSAALHNLMNTKIMSKKMNIFYYAAEGWSIFAQLFSLHGGRNIEQEIAGLRNLALLAPATIAGWAGYRSISNIYQKFIASDYSPIRRALIDVNSLFVDQTRSLNDEQYGKLIYLVYNLKKRAEKDLPLNVRADFIEDLERIELQEFDVAAKRRIVEDMFKKYSFLRLV